jgi:hypothetical protein
MLLIIACESSRVAPEVPRPNPPAPPPAPLVLSGFVRDATSKAAIDGATVKISKADGTLLATTLSNSSGKYSYDVTNITDNVLSVSATKSGYGFSKQVAEINRAINSASVDDILILALQATTQTVTPAAGGTVNNPNNQSLGNQTTTVNVPPNAVAQNVQISVASIPAAQVPPPAAATNQSVLAAGNFQPTGTRFQVPVTVTLPLPIRKPAGTTFPLQILNEATGAYTNSGFTATVDASGTQASAPVTHFTIYTIADNKATLNLPDASPVNTGTSETLEVTAASTSASKTVQRVVSITLSGGSGSVNESWLIDEIKNTLNLVTGTFNRQLDLSFNITSPESQGGKPTWVQNGIIVGPTPGQAGDALKRAKYNLQSKTRTGSVSGNTGANAFTRNVTVVEQLWVLDAAASGWFWRVHGQGTGFTGPY